MRASKDARSGRFTAWVIIVAVVALESLSLSIRRGSTSGLRNTILSSAISSWWSFLVSGVYMGSIARKLVLLERLMPNKSLQPAPVGVVSFADADHVVGPAWLSFGR